MNIRDVIQAVDSRDISFPLIVKSALSSCESVKKTFHKLIETKEDVENSLNDFNFNIGSYIEPYIEISNILSVTIVKTSSFIVPYVVADCLYDDLMRFVAVTAPSQVPPSSSDEVLNAALKLIRSLGGKSAGVYTVKLFLLQDGNFFVNKIYCR